MTERINYLKMELSAITANQSFARSTVAAFASALDPTLDEINDIKTAVSEAVTNAVVHGYDGVEGTIVIECELFPQSVRIGITDKGMGISDVNHSMQPFVTSKPGDERSGMGFTVMQSFMDSVNVTSRDGGGTTVIMDKYFANKSNNKVVNG